MRAVESGHNAAKRTTCAQLAEPRPGLLRRACRWVKRAPHERVPFPVGAAIYASGGALSLMDAPGLGVAAVAAAGSFAGYVITNKKARDEVLATKAATAIGASGVWLSMAAELGPMWGPHGALSWAYLTLFGVGYAIHRMDDKTRRDIAWRKERVGWHTLSRKFGLEGSHLLENTQTRLGEKFVVDVIGTGKRASSLAGKPLEELIAEHYKIPAHRVETSARGIAGRLVINIKRVDPWSSAIQHPALNPDAEISLPEIADVRKPQIIGQDPDSGDPLEFIAWDEDGAAHWLIVAIKGGGKTVLLNDIMERLTAADNVAVWGIDVSKAKDMRRWRDGGALDLSACGPGDRRKAVKMLELAAQIIAHRAAHNTDAVFQPRYGHPMIEIVIDEVDALMAGTDAYASRAQKALKTITSKGRSESVGVILVGQRGSAAWLGGADIRANLDRFAFLKVSRANELALAAGELGLSLPDMSKYGENNPGVVCLADLSGDSAKGRTFLLKDLDDVGRIASTRSPSPLEPDLLADRTLGEKYRELKGETQATPIAPATPEAAMSQLDEEVEAILPVDLREEWDAHMNKQRIEEARRTLDANAALPEIDEEMSEKLRAAAAERQRQAIEQTEITPDYRSALIEMLGRPGGAQISEVMALLNCQRTNAFNVLAKLRGEGVAESTGKGRAARWVLSIPSDSHSE